MKATKNKIVKISAVLFAALIAFCAVPDSKVTGRATEPQLTVYSLPVAGVVFGQLICNSTIYGPDEAELAKAKTDIMNALKDINASVSTTDSSSTLYKFNTHMSADEFPIDYHMHKLLQKAKVFYAESDGIFNPAVLPLLELWGLDAQNINKPSHTLPKYEEVLTTKELCDFDKISFRSEGGKYYASKAPGYEEIKLDFGAQAKGYACDVIVGICEAYGLTAARVNISGNLYEYKLQPKFASGVFSGEFVKWPVGINNPDYESLNPKYNDPSFAHLLCEDESIVTSGDYERWYSEKNSEGTALHFTHIIDMRTGLPINVKYDETKKTYVQKTDSLRSMTIFDKSSEEADINTTVGIVLGFEDGIKYLKDIADGKGVGYGFVMFDNNPAGRKYAAYGEFEFNPDYPIAGSYLDYTPVVFDGIKYEFNNTVNIKPPKGNCNSAIGPGSGIALAVFALLTPFWLLLFKKKKLGV